MGMLEGGATQSINCTFVLEEVYTHICKYMCVYVHTHA